MTSSDRVFNVTCDFSHLLLNSNIANVMDDLNKQTKNFKKK